MPADTPPDYRYWPDYHKSPLLAVERRPLLDETTKVFTMGSCFAGEVTNALIARGIDVYPKYDSIVIDPAVEIFAGVPERNFVSHYDTFSIRQEFETAFGVFTDRAQGFYPVENAAANQRFNSPVVYQDPYRKLAYAVDLPRLTALSDTVSRKIREGIVAADLLVITMGLTEVWQHKSTGRYFGRPPGSGFGGGEGAATFRQSTFAENYENMRVAFDLLFTHFPEKQVVLSVSPVPLERTYSKTDIGTANLESKSILRAVAGQICREYAKNVMYLPSYEMATMMPGPVFKEDGRHVLPDFARRVIDVFLKFCTKPPRA